MKRGRLIALISQKGGTGKTTVTMQLAAGLTAARGLKVGIADLDPQESALRWAESASAEAPFPAEVRAIRGSADEIAASLEGLRKGKDYLLVDCPPSIENQHSLAALAQANLALVPVVPSPPDLWSTRAVERLILQRMSDNASLRGALLPNRVQRTALSGTVLEVMREFTLPVIGAALSQRNAYAQSAVIGGSVFQLGKAAEAAQEEVIRMADAVIKLAPKGKRT